MVHQNYKTYFIVMVILLLGSVYPSVHADVTPNNGLATGDKFTFHGSGAESEIGYRNNDLTNASTGARIYFGEEGNWRDIYDETDTDIGIIKQRPSLPPIDTVMVMNTNGLTQPGSREDRYRNESRYDQNGQLYWDNYTEPTQDLSGRGIHDDGGDNSGMGRSNATYAVIFPEMEMMNVSIPSPGLQFNISYNWNVPLSSRTITSGSQNFNINQNTHTITYTNVSQVFHDLYEENVTSWFNFGDAGFNANYTVAIDITYHMWFVFDTATKMVVQVGEKSEFHLNVLIRATNQYTNLNPQDPNSHPGAINFMGEWNTASYRFRFNTMTEASAMYGHSRPTTTGSSPLADGDVLKFRIEQRNKNYLSVHMDASNGGYNNEERGVESDTKGNLTIDVFRNGAGFFDAIIFMNGESNGKDYWSKNWYENGVDMNDQGQNTYGPQEAMMADLLSSPSTTSQEVQPNFSDNMSFQDRIFQCNDGNCGNDFVPQFPNDAPRTSTTTNVTDWYVDLVAQGEDPLVINGHNYYYFNISINEVDYERVESFIQPIPIGDNNQVWVNATTDISYHGKTAWYYDKDTGALVAYEEYFKGSVHIYGNFTNVIIDPNQPATDINIDAWLNSEYQMNFFLTDHPNHYDVGQTIKTTEDTNTTTPVESSPVNDSSVQDSPGLSLPVSITPVVTSIFVAVFIARRRK